MNEGNYLCIGSIRIGPRDEMPVVCMQEMVLISYLGFYT